MRLLTLTLSHPYKGMRERTRKQAEGRYHPPWGRVVLPGLPLGRGVRDAGTLIGFFREEVFANQQDQSHYGSDEKKEKECVIECEVRHVGGKATWFRERL